MKLEFKTIQIHSFMSFEDETFDFSTADGMTLIRGRNNDVPSSLNGSGKSNLMNSLLYVLFGQLQIKLKKNENIVNRNVSDRDMRLVLDFSSDGESFRVTRGMAKGKSSYLELEKLVDGKYEKITKSSIAETQEYLETQVLKCDATIFMRTIFLTADQDYNFYTLKKADKKEFVEKMFDIQVFGQMYDLIHRDLLDTDKKILAGQNRAVVLGNQIKDCTDRSDRFDSDKRSEETRLAKSVEEAKAAYESLKDKTVSVNQEAVDKLNEAVAKIDSLAGEVNSEILDLYRKRQKIELAMSKAKQSIQYKQQALAKHSDLTGKLCDDCRDVYLRHSGIDGYGAEIQNLTAEAEKFGKAKALVDKKIEDAESRKNKYSEKRKAAAEKTKQLTREADLLRSEISGAKSRLDMAERDLARNAASKNPYRQMLAESKKSLADESENLKKTGQHRQYLQTAQSIVSQDTLRKFVIRDLVGLLNNRIRTYLTRLGANYYVKFDDDMDFEFVPTKGTCEFGNFSAGERMRLMVATSFAFRDFMAIRNGLTSNVLILDEYFDSAIDPLCVESILGVLSDYKNKMGQNIFVISHRQEVSQEYFDRIVTVEKTNGISRIAR